jgi:pimeloyl-ACP methyl ester carboxylesterase
MSAPRAAEHHIAVRRTARFCTLGPADAADVWIVLHGYAQLARYFIRSFAPIDDGSRLIVAPEALNRYYVDRPPGTHAADAHVGATWMTREDRALEIDDYVGYLDTLAAHVLNDGAHAGSAPVTVARAAGAASVTRRVTVLGFSQGAATASRWAARGSTRVDRLILWGAGTAHDLTPAPDLFRGAELSIAVGRDDTHVSEERISAEHERLRSAGLHSELIRYDGGHRIDAYTLRRLAIV